MDLVPRLLLITPPAISTDHAETLHALIPREIKNYSFQNIFRVKSTIGRFLQAFIINDGPINDERSTNLKRRIKRYSLSVFHINYYINF